MSTIRIIFLAIVSTIFSTSAFASDAKSIFNGLPSCERLFVQKTLKKQKLYNSTLDGLWGNGTKKAIDKFAKNYFAKNYGTGSAMSVIALTSIVAASYKSGACMKGGDIKTAKKDLYCENPNYNAAYTALNGTKQQKDKLLQRVFPQNANIFEDKAVLNSGRQELKVKGNPSHSGLVVYTIYADDGWYYKARHNSKKKQLSITMYKSGYMDIGPVSYSCNK